jgi:L-2,4-diaminobutyrate decarboxylase
MTDRLRSAFDPDEFRRLGRQVVDLLAEHLAACHERRIPVLPWRDPEASLSAWRDAPRDPLALLQRFVAESNHLHHPRFLAHQVTPPLPLAALTRFVAAFLNNGLAVYEMSPAGTPIERLVVAWMTRQLALPPAAGGTLVSGGSLGNLTALLAARAVAEAGSGPGRWAILVSEQAHYCIPRAARVMGLGSGGIEPVPVDDAFRMRPDALAPAVARVRARGHEPLAVVANACSTATGAFDPLPAIAEFCAAQQLWLHVDGAHGASVALSPKLRPLIAGIERADSIVWDAHKLLLMPSLLTGVLYRDDRHAEAAFAERADYLFTRGGGGPDLGRRSLECTKPTMALDLFATLVVHGPELLAEQVEARVAAAQRFAALLRDAGDFELAVPPPANILCFRHLPRGEADPDARQTRVRRALLEAGSFHVVQTVLRERVWLRTTLLNPATTDDDFTALIAAIRAIP